MGQFSVTVSKDYLVFSAAHFITFRGHKCESLHGHNYRLGITVEGPIDKECLFVVDFAILKAAVRSYVDIMDHRVLLPTENPKLEYRTEGHLTRVDYFGEPTYTFPTSDCAMLPIKNTTAEMIAEWVAHGVAARLTGDGVIFDRLALEVEESTGQCATYLMDAETGTKGSS